MSVLKVYCVKLASFSGKAEYRLDYLWEGGGEVGFD